MTTSLAVLQTLPLLHTHQDLRSLLHYNMMFSALLQCHQLHHSPLGIITYPLESIHSLEL